MLTIQSLNKLSSSGRIIKLSAKLVCMHSIKMLDNVLVVETEILISFFVTEIIPGIFLGKKIEN